MSQSPTFVGMHPWPESQEIVGIVTGPSAVHVDLDDEYSVQGFCRDYVDRALVIRFASRGGSTVAKEAALTFDSVENFTVEHVNEPAEEADSFYGAAWQSVGDRASFRVAIGLAILWFNASGASWSTRE
ncbi:hypothetical protein IN07_03540 [Modestobacter caceresii]|uniref:Uncharacterized protein n=2 Tax=Geodermatophilaceae TaxID=85030 RepID=A0A098YCE7_9ACTN|nr:hypothetical protein IN07_03540 [Modestobacter caceresii]